MAKAQIEARRKRRLGLKTSSGKQTRKTGAQRRIPTENRYWWRIVLSYASGLGYKGAGKQWSLQVFSGDGDVMMMMVVMV